MSLAPANAPRASFRHLGTLWIQVTGTRCNLTCSHCFNTSGPKDPWLKHMTTAQVVGAIDEAVALGVKELYFIGEAPFLRPDFLEYVAYALRRAPTIVLTHETLIGEARSGPFDRWVRTGVLSREACKGRRSECPSGSSLP